MYKIQIKTFSDDFKIYKVTNGDIYFVCYNETSAIKLLNSIAENTISCVKKYERG